MIPPSWRTPGGGEKPSATPPRSTGGDTVESNLPEPNVKDPPLARNPFPSETRPDPNPRPTDPVVRPNPKNPDPPPKKPEGPDDLPPLE